MDLLKIENFSKKYGKLLALDNINITVTAGKIVGLLGPNGCGKTTLMKSISGLLPDYNGTLLIEGNSPGTETKNIISYLPEATYLPSWMKPSDTIDFFSDFYVDFDKQKAEELLHRFNLSQNVSLKTMSKGMQEKVQLILVMSRKAKLYILDEPISGVDPASRDTILDIILKNYAENASVILSTHLIYDVERIFDEVIIMGNGKILRTGNCDDIRAQTGLSLNDYFREVFANVN